MKEGLRLLVPVAVLMACAGGAASCAPAKGRIQPGSSPQNSGDLVGWEWNWAGLRGLIRVLQRDPMGMAPQELKKLWMTYADSAVLRPANGPPRIIGVSELVGTAMGFDSNGDGKVSTAELEGVEESRILRWLPPGSPGRPCADFDGILRQEVPQASAAAVHELAQAICWLDAPEFGGNGDLHVSRAELGSGGWFEAVWKASAGLAAALRDGNGAPPPPAAAERWRWLWPRTPKLVAWLEGLIGQQAFGRYERWESKALKEADRRLEWVALSLRGYVARRLARVGTGTEGVSQAQLTASLLRLDLRPEQIGREARLWYDLKWANAGGGSVPGDNELQWEEIFYLLVDAEFMKRVVDRTGGDFRLDHWAELRAHDADWQALFRAMPRARAAFGLGSGDAGDARHPHVLRGFWNSFQSFDQLSRGGDGDGRLELGEALLAWNAARRVDQWLDRYDVNRSGILEAPEAEAFTRALKAEQPALLRENPFTRDEPVSDVLTWIRYVTGTQREVPASIVALDLYSWLAQSLSLVR